MKVIDWIHAKVRMFYVKLTVYKLTHDPEYQAWAKERQEKYGECAQCGYWGGRHSPFCPGHEDWDFIKKCMKEYPDCYGHWRKEVDKHDKKQTQEDRRKAK